MASVELRGKAQLLNHSYNTQCTPVHSELEFL